MSTKTNAMYGVQRAICQAQRSRAKVTSSISVPPILHLDFLAPSWPQQRRSITLKSQRHFPAVRHLSNTAIRRTKAIANARKDEEGNEMLITITPRAESRMKAIAEKDKNPDLALRVSVESGGCHGFQYLMKLINKSDIDPEDDTVFANEATQGTFSARVVMDEPSLELLKGASIDYTMELIGSQFKVTNIPGATSSCGCGTSFDVAA